jgi:hypothetical protein
MKDTSASAKALAKGVRDQPGQQVRRPHEGAVDAGRRREGGRRARRKAEGLTWRRRSPT